MKKLIEIWNGKSLHERYPYKTRWYHKHLHAIITTARKTMLALFALTLVATSYMGAYFAGNFMGKATTPQVSYANVEVEKIVEVESKTIPPVLQRIANCESGSKHFDKSGQVLMRGNTNKTVDIGIMQINEYYWGKKASELGYDLTKEKDNWAMAKWIYANHGTEPWVHSKTCWNK